MNLEQPKDDTRDPAAISDIFTRLGRHFHTMEKYALAGKKHTWILMSKDALEAICILNANTRELIGIVAQINRQAGKTTQGVQAGDATIMSRLAAVEAELASANKKLRSLMVEAQ